MRGPAALADALPALYDLARLGVLTVRGWRIESRRAGIPYARIAAAAFGRHRAAAAGFSKAV